MINTFSKHRVYDLPLTIRNAPLLLFLYTVQLKHYFFWVIFLLSLYAKLLPTENMRTILTDKKDFIGNVSDVIRNYELEVYK